MWEVLVVINANEIAELESPPSVVNTALKMNTESIWKKLQPLFFEYQKVDKFIQLTSKH